MSVHRIFWLALIVELFSQLPLWLGFSRKDLANSTKKLQKKLLFQKVINVIVKSERISRGYLFPNIGIECSTFFTDKGLLRFHRVFPSAFRDNDQ